MTVSAPWPPGALVGGGRYRIEATIGSGGAGLVYRAVQLELCDQVAIKVSAAVDNTALEALREEARLLRRLRHPHLPQVSDFFVEEGWPCLVMEFIDGQDLHQLQAERGGALAEPEALALIGQVAEALAYLHAQQPPIIHRDVKPANIRVRPSGEVVLVDFGIAKVGDSSTQTHVMAKGFGTPPYAPPEQYGSGKTDAYTDVYALGATLYELLTGELPAESVHRQVGTPLIPPRQLVPAVSARAEQLILTAMALASAERFPSARELLEALRSDQPLASPTIVLDPSRNCPACGAELESAISIFCMGCGAPLSLRFPRTGRALMTTDSLAATCDGEWDTAVEHLRSRRLQRWLESRGEVALLERARQALARHPEDYDAALELLLRPAPPADLTADREKLDFGAQAPEYRPTLDLHLRLGAPGYLHGQAQALAEWLTVTPATLSVRPGQPIPPVVVGVRSGSLSAAQIDRTLTGTVKVTTNRGVIELPARLSMHHPPRPEAPPLICCGKVESRQRIELRVALRNAGGGVCTGQISSRQPWLTVESQHARFELRRGEQHTVAFSIDARKLGPSGAYGGSLLWETDQGNLLTRVQVEVTPPYEVSPGDSATTISQVKDLVRLCDCLRGGDPYAWERGVGFLRGGKLTDALRFFHKEDLAHEAEVFAQHADCNTGLELLLRRLGAKPARHFKDNQGSVLGQITGPLSRKPAEVEYAVLNTSKRGYLYGYLRPLVEWISIPEPHFGCLPDQEAVVKLFPDYARRARVPLFKTVDLFEVVIE